MSMRIIILFCIMALIPTGLARAGPLVNFTKEPLILFKKQVYTPPRFEQTSGYVPSLVDVSLAFGSTFVAVALVERPDLRVAILISPTGLIYSYAVRLDSNGKRKGELYLFAEFLDTSGNATHNSRALGEFVPKLVPTVIMNFQLPNGIDYESATGDFGFLVNAMNTPPNDAKFIRFTLKDKSLTSADQNLSFLFALESSPKRQP